MTRIFHLEGGLTERMASRNSTDNDEGSKMIEEVQAQAYYFW
jgi:hypothetical protein